MRANFRCLYLQKAGFGPTTVNVFENKSEDRNTCNCCVRQVQITTARNIKRKNTKWGIHEQMHLGTAKRNSEDPTSHIQKTKCLVKNPVRTINL